MDVEASSGPSSSSLFAFTAGPRPAFVLSFPPPSSSNAARPKEEQQQQQQQSSWRRLKRHRPLTDVDGEWACKSRRKRRRLRLVLITSRLSRPFSAPPTYIVDRGSSKIAIWAKQRHLGTDQLRKVAIMNDIRMRVAEAQRAKRWQMEVARQAFMYGLGDPRAPPDGAVDHVPNSQPDSDPSRSRRQRSVDAPTTRPYRPRPPSPGACSNYDVLDREDDEAAAAMDGDGTDRVLACAFYSDFSSLQHPHRKPSLADPYDEPLDSLERRRTLSPMDRPPSPPDEKTLELMRERERQKEVSFIQFGNAC
ncbi:MAG: hypothetical protein M1815_002970 [Lichina confinis]|nr:MAG: hypothetical protein M1815_002970 [Lichina confinis]